jgi:hypothetical protein
MKPLLQTYTVGSGGQTVPVDKNSTVNARWTMESIEWRANYVGPVLEDILHEMQEHGGQHQDEEVCPPWNPLKAGF